MDLKLFIFSSVLFVVLFIFLAFDLDKRSFFLSVNLSNQYLFNILIELTKVIVTVVTIATILHLRYIILYTLYI